MRNSLLVLTALAMAMFASCNREEVDAFAEREIYEVKDLTFTATLADKPVSKTVLDNGDVLWTPGDAINLFFSDHSQGQFTTNIDTPSATAEFTGTLSVATGSGEGGTTGKAFWAVYPYNESNTCDGTGVTLSIPSEQTAFAGSFADKLNPSVATSPGLDLAFYNVCAPFYFSVTHSGVISATFSGNNHEVVAGRVRVTMNSNGYPVAEKVSGVRKITITAPDGGFVPGTTYVVLLLPQTLSAGYTLRLRTEDAYADCVVSKSAEFIRSQGRSKMNADEGLAYTEVMEAVDLGLSVMWAAMNIGASTPEQSGDYYAWGETATNPWGYNSYKWGTVKYQTLATITKYNTMSSYGDVDNKTVLELEDDVAHVKLGGKWRIPTIEEWDELRYNTILTETSNNGSIGRLVTSINNGNSIFLPSTGGYMFNDMQQNAYNGYYWSSSLRTDGPAQAYCFRCSYNIGCNRDLLSRCNRVFVRPVKDFNLEITSGTFSGDSDSLSLTTSSGITISQLKNEGTSCNTNFNTVSTLRIYKANQLQFTGRNFSKIEIFYTGSYSGTEWSIVNGGGTVAIDSTNNKVIWENSVGASEVTLQNSSNTGSNVQLRTTKFVVTQAKAGI